MSLLFNMLSRLVIAFLPRSKRLLISWLQSPSAVILEPPKIKSVIVSIVSSSICHEVMGLDARWFTQSVNIYSYYVPGISFMSKGKEEKGEGRERGNRHSCRNNACLASLDLQFCIFTFKVSLLTLNCCFYMLSMKPQEEVVQFKSLFVCSSQVLMQLYILNCITEFHYSFIQKSSIFSQFLIL